MFSALSELQRNSPTPATKGCEMSKPSYEELVERGKRPKRKAGDLIDKASEQEQVELFELSVLCNISQALASTMDLDEILIIVIDEVNKALLTEGAGLLLYDEIRGDLYWRQIRDARKILPPLSDALRLPLDNSIAGWVFKNNRPARVNDTPKDPRYYPEFFKISGVRVDKVLQVPLNTRQKTIGVLMAMNKIGGDFTDQDEKLLTSMAGSVALAVENASIYQKLKKSRDDLEMLFRSSTALATTMDLDHLLEVLLSELRSALDTEAAGVLLYDERRGDLYCREAQDDSGRLNTASRELRIPLDRSISGQVFQTGEPVLLNDPSSNPDFFSPFQDRAGFVTRNEIIVPLHTREKTIGCLVTMNRRHGQFIEYDVQLLTSLAGVVALAVENYVFFEELVRSYGELDALNRTKSKIINHLSHELRTPLAIVMGTLATLERKLQERDMAYLKRPVERMKRHVQGLTRLADQVESIMRTGYSWERRMITGFLQSAMDLMEVQTEYTPQIREAAQVIHQWLEKTFPTRQDVPECINIRRFGEEVQQFVTSKAEDERRKINFTFDLEEAELLIPRHVLEAIIEGLVRNAVEATPDGGSVAVTGQMMNDRYLVKVKDTGVGIPEKEKSRIFEGFCPVQNTENYASKRPYSFNAGGKGIDLLRIRMFTEIYGCFLTFTTRRCPHLVAAESRFPVNVDYCAQCDVRAKCAHSGGSEFVAEFPLASSKAATLSPMQLTNDATGNID